MIGLRCMIIPWYLLISLSIVTLDLPYVIETIFRDLEGGMTHHRTFSIGNLTTKPKLGFSHTCFSFKNYT